MTQQNIPVHKDTYDQVTLLARAWEVPPGEVVRRLIEHFQQPIGSPSPTQSEKGIAVHAIYDGTRITGLFDPATGALTITGGPGAGSYRTPSGAAGAVLQALRPQVKPNRNGWSFWTIDETGELLQTLRGR